MKPHEIPLKSHVFFFFAPTFPPCPSGMSRPPSHGRLASLAAGRNEATAEELAGEASLFSRAVESWFFIGESSPNGPTIQVSEI